jgi:DNA primase
MPDSIEDVLHQIGIEVHGGGKELACSCPFHADRHPSFSVNATSGLWICYSCGRGGSLPMLIQEVGDSDADPAVILRDIKHQAISSARHSVHYEEPEAAPPPEPLFIFARYESYGPVPAWALDSRSIDAAQAARYGLKWDKGWVLPIWDPYVAEPQLGLLGYQWKRLSVVSNWPQEVKKSHTLFGLREQAGGTIALVESPLDVVRMAMVGVSAVAAFGAYVSKDQLHLLVEAADRIIVALDDDTAGNQQATKIYPYLARHVPTTRAVFPRGCKDPGDMTDDQIVRTFSDVQRRAFPVPTRRRRHDADPAVLAPRSRPGPR